ncbi:MAG TPA: metal-sulfur cluster assembly factor [Verrucomicrobiae bacterium]
MNTIQLDEATVLDTLKQVIDPELDCNIVDLGLVYSVEINGAHVKVTMTLTTPGCPMHESIAAGVQHAVLALDGVEQVDVEVVWDPPWHPAMMTREGQEQLNQRRAL